MRYRILPYRQGSRSAHSLAGALGGKVLKLSGSSYKPRGGDVLINWGNTTPTGLTALLNPPERILGASNKLRFFQKMAEAGHTSLIPPFWTNQDDIPDDAFPVVCRTVLAGHSGDGIVMADSREALVAAPLYVQYLKKKEEYRVHIGRKEVTLPQGALEAGEYVLPNETTALIAVQRKVRRNDTPDADVNWKVRSHHNGFVFQRNGINPHDDVISAARTALVASGLDFGAVDVIFNSHNNKATVLEINTAPGLEGQTIQDYASFFRNV